MSKTTIPQPLTVSEAKELKSLSNQIFQGSMFVEISDEERNQPHIQRYEELLNKKMKYLHYMQVAPVLN